MPLSLQAQLYRLATALEELVDGNLENFKRHYDLTQRLEQISKQLEALKKPEGDSLDVSVGKLKVGNLREWVVKLLPWALAAGSAAYHLISRLHT